MCQEYGVTKCVHKVIRFFLGLHKYVPVLAFTGDMGWDSCEVRWKANMVSLWNRLMGLPITSVASEIFNWDLSVGGEWVSEALDLLEERGLEENDFQKTNVEVKDFKYQVWAKCSQSRAEEIWQKPKLRTYCLFKKDVKNMLSMICLQVRDHYVHS